MATLYLVRHGESQANVGHVIDGRDLPLTARGRRQAAAAAEWLTAAGAAAVYASPYRRTQETAGVIAARLKRPIETAPELEEVEVGELAGRADPDAHAAYERVFARWLEGELDARFPGGETLREARARMAAFLEHAAARHAGEAVVAVGHGALPHAVLPRLVAVDPGVAGRVELAAITTLRLQIDGAWAVDAAGWSAAEHLAGLD